MERAPRSVVLAGVSLRCEDGRYLVASPKYGEAD